MITPAAIAPEAFTLDERTTGFAFVTTTAEWLQPISINETSNARMRPS